ncbi:hypothetical protein QAD02_005393 [Eretmocerus hayati]|uniref:Uncharacterized protein n=1 Tax=Eretmocerus hayati TaxID=131215 RepID=A0ACC2NTG3_9HYME|nr:hypothetical protein QAD02_005393 [Eretmocerus hayati]
MGLRFFATGDFQVVIGDLRGFSQTTACRVIHRISAAVDPRGEFLFIDVRHPESVHDTTALDRSVAKMLFEEGGVKGFLIADKGFPSKTHFLIPCVESRTFTGAQKKYNRSVNETRNGVERNFGQ